MKRETIKKIILHDYLKYIEIASKQILEYCNSLNQELQKEAIKNCGCTLKAKICNF